MIFSKANGNPLREITEDASLSLVMRMVFRKCELKEYRLFLTTKYSAN